MKVYIWQAESTNSDFELHKEFTILMREVLIACVNAGNIAVEPRSWSKRVYCTKQTVTL